MFVFLTRADTQRCIMHTIRRVMCWCLCWIRAVRSKRFAPIWFVALKTNLMNLRAEPSSIYYCNKQSDKFCVVEKGNVNKTLWISAKKVFACGREKVLVFCKFIQPVLFCANYSWGGDLHGGSEVEHKISIQNDAGSNQGAEHASLGRTLNTGTSPKCCLYLSTLGWCASFVVYRLICVNFVN